MLLHSLALSPLPKSLSGFRCTSLAHTLGFSVKTEKKISEKTVLSVRSLSVLPVGPHLASRVLNTSTHQPVLVRSPTALFLKLNKPKVDKSNQAIHCLASGLWYGLEQASFLQNTHSMLKKNWYLATVLKLEVRPEWHNGQEGLWNHNCISISWYPFYYTGSPSLSPVVSLFAKERVSYSLEYVDDISMVSFNWFLCPLWVGHKI